MEVARLLEAVGVPGRPVAERSLSGDSGTRVRVVEIDGEGLVVVKTIPEACAETRHCRSAKGGSTRIHEEAAGLALIAATGTVSVPRVLGCGMHLGTGILVLEHLEVTTRRSGDDAAWVDFGRDLADLHLATPPDCGDRFGLDHDNHLGSTLQDNRPESKWGAFLVNRRIRPMIEGLDSRRLLRPRERTGLESLAERIGDLLPPDIRPGLVHGDLWRGNALLTEDRGVFVIDPAVVIADPLFEIGMMRLFGGFPATCEAALLGRLAEVGGDGTLERSEVRIELGRLHHLLNHWLIFGRDYAPPAIRCVAELAG